MQPDPELFIAHAASLRALARGLVGGDASAAEDLVQETWVRALERPPRHAERLRAWLAAVLDSLAYKHRRSDSRRVHRERGSARREAVASECELGLELEERKRCLRLVSEAVLGLEEPYLSTILLRYYEDLSPAEIAHRTRTPLPTVKSRLQRGLARLRTRLDEGQWDGEHGWARALCALTGVELSSGAGLPNAIHESLATGALLMTQKTKLSIAAALLLLLGIGTWTAIEWMREPEHSRVAAGRAIERPSLTSTDGERDAANELELASITRMAQPTLAEEEEDEPIDEGTELMLTVIVHDGNDLPLAGARVLAGPPMAPLNDVGQTDESGRLVLRWLSQERRSELILHVEDGPRAASGLRRVKVGHRPQQLAFQLRMPAIVSNSRPQDRLLAMRDLEMGLILREARGSTPAPKALRDEQGRLRFVHPWEQAARSPKPEVIALYKLQLALELKKMRELDRALMALDAAAALGIAPGTQPTVEVQGTVRDANGETLEGVLVMAHHDGGKRQVRTDESGSYRIEKLHAGELRLRAGGGDHGLDEDLLGGVAGTTVFWDPALDRGLELKGRVLDDRGTPRAHWIVDIAGEHKRSGVFADTTFTAEDGRFTIPNLPKGMHELSIRSPGLSSPLPTLTLDRVRAGGRDAELRIGERELPTAGVVVRLESAQGDPAEAGEVRLWMVGNARGIRLRAVSDGRFEARELPPGRYTLTAGNATEGWTERAGFVLRAGNSDDLGSFALPEGGRLEVSASESDEPRQYTLFELRDGLRLFVGELEATGAFSRSLREGRFELHRGASHRSFTLRAGEPVRVAF